MLNKWTYLFHLYFVLKLLYYVYIYKKGENSDLCKPVLLDIRQTTLCNLFGHEKIDCHAQAGY